jgi:hypothetical protein
MALEPGESPRPNTHLTTGKPSAAPLFAAQRIVEDRSEYSDPDLSEPSDCDDGSSLTTEDLIFIGSIQTEQDIPRSTSQILAMQPDFNPSARERAVTLIIHFNCHFLLTSDSLCNAVTYLDIFLSSVPIAETEIELLATVCYWLLAKVETGAQPSIEKINAATGNSHSSEMFRESEVRIVNALGFRLSFPTPKLFMTKFLERSDANKQVIEASNALVEIALMKFKFVDIRPSMIAAAAVAVAWASIGQIETARRIVAVAHLPRGRYLGPPSERADRGGPSLSN